MTTTAPRTLDDLLAILPGLRRKRSLNADWLRVLLDRQSGQCTWCGNIVPRGRREWCGDACVVAFKERCDSQYVRRLVIARDNGICQSCGRDTNAAEKEFEAERKRLGYLSFDERLNPIRSRLGYARGRWREVDHKRPVCDGGGLVKPDGLWTLCGACHLLKTSARR